jgi:hypothetical protein
LNVFRATAFNRQRTESSPVEYRIKLDAAEAKVTLHVLAVGINKYKNEVYSLDWARPDAEAFVEAIKMRGRPIFRDILNFKGGLYDDRATRANIEAAFKEIQADPNDVFVFYYAGHGAMNEGGDGKHAKDFYLALHDVTKFYGDDEQLSAKGISAAELAMWVAGIKAQKKLIILDACQSGGAVAKFDEMAQVVGRARAGPAREKAIFQLARSAGVTVVAAAGTEQFAIEVKELGHGLFTYALLKGLAGEADTSGDGTITVVKLVAYLSSQVPLLSERYRRMTQYPEINMRGSDFPLALR